MAKIIKIKKGLNIKLKGAADRIVVNSLNTISEFAVKPTDYIGLRPKMLVSEGDVVKAGTPLFYNKNNESVIFTAPVSGTVKAIRRGEKRVIQEVVIENNGEFLYENFESANPLQLGKQDIIDKMVKSGVWTLLRQRPFATVADPATEPKAIFISGFDTAPLAPDYDLVVRGRGEAFQTGLDALSKLAKVHLSLNPNFNYIDEFKNAKNVTIHQFEGKHPAGNVGVQINHIDPINKGDIVWVVNPQDVITIGTLFKEGVYRPEKLVALCGSSVGKPQYYRTYAGACIKSLIETQVREENVRYISGNVLTGTKIEKDGFLGAYDNQFTVIPEGDKYEFMGWLAPGLSKFSFSHTFLSGFANCFGSSKEYVIDTNMHGEKRAYVVTGEYEKVMPMNIYPMQLIKACVIGDIDEMEALGIYEVEPEDFALCEFIDTSKTEIQTIIRDGLETIRKEMC
ncbi:MAG: Na(+)-translocating NADH-quinone reductase subunit A [Bacteroidales bacterium]|nr:Na(+)-translocating NADH-quinone reductase subunit A [Bacteroidales bacterium]